MDKVERIEVDPDVMAGKPVVKGTRIPVYIILEMFEEGKGMQDILEAYPDLEKKDVQACLKYATQRVRGESTKFSETVA